jgi:hypothetical protein
VSASHVEAELDHVTVLHDVVLAIGGGTTDKWT